MLEALFNKVTGLCFPVNNAKPLRTSILKNGYLQTASSKFLHTIQLLEFVTLKKSQTQHNASLKLSSKLKLSISILIIYLCQMQ